ncbi:MAG: 4Fe-4S binding protein [Cyanobacteria bacterium]|nr:4Fe-4S binding protein [Cyanobacteriota bacterium]MDA1020529.1 4Fe-4S binding protein [Cyanobacteriota bacterium]
MHQTKPKHLKHLEEHKFHKLIIGAALKDYKTIEEYSQLFTHAGADVIDISAFPHSVISAKQGIANALKEDANLTVPLIMVSVNIGQDPHFRRIELQEENCTECLACVPTCPSGAFQNNEFSYNDDLCFGCSLCLPSCHFDALKFTNWSAFETKSLIELQELGARAIEIHLNNDLHAFSEFYKSIPEFELESFCIGSGQMDPAQLVKAAETIIQEVKNKHDAAKALIIQVDGKAMSGAAEQNTDIVSIEAAKSIMHLQSDTVFIQLAGGITDQSFTKAFKAGVKVNGVAIGSYARKKISTIRKFSNKIEFAAKLVQNPGTQSLDN